MHTNPSERPDYEAMSPAQLIAVIDQLEAALAEHTLVEHTTPGQARSGHNLASAESARPGAEQFFQLYAEHVPDMIWVSQPNPARLLWASPACSDLLGVAPAGLLSELRHWRSLVHPDDVALLECALLRHEQTEPSEVEFRFIRPDGELRWLRVRTFAPSDAVLIDGQSVIFGVTEDVTPRREQEAQRLVQVHQQRIDLIREVHHRIKNNLQGVAGLLRQHAELFPELLPVIDQAITRVRAIAVIHGLQGQTPDAKVVLCELIPAIAQSVETLLAPRVAFTVQTEIPERICVKEQEAVPLALVLNELIMNSAKHASHAGHAGQATPIHITLTWESQSNQAKIRIVNPGHLPDNFDFSQPTGIGLSLVRSLLPPHGSSLSYDNADNLVTAHLHLSAPCIHFDKIISQAAGN
jgi:PAS domain S-box-containing protein